jgi:uncharacterized protein (DUF608 family)
MPLALFNFTLENKSAEAVDAALLATAPNLVGWDGYEKLKDHRTANYVANFNELTNREDTTLLHMQTRPGTPPAFANKVDLHTNDRGLASVMAFCNNVKVHFNDFKPNASPAAVWIRRYDNADALVEGLDALENGATLVLSGDASALLAIGATEGINDNRVVFEDWEKGNFDGWTVEGTCFGPAPMTGTPPNQQTVSGWTGKAYVNSFASGDDRTGRALSKPFTVDRKYVHIEVGGGNWPGETCVNLVVDDHVVESATGDNSERLRSVRWDVSEHRGKTATIEILDSRTGDWGHILVGDIAFSDSSLSPFTDPALLQRCREAMPLTWSSGEIVEAPASLRGGSKLLAGLPASDLKTKAYASLKGAQPKPDARVFLETADGQPLVVAGPHGKGTVVVCNGPVHEWFGAAATRTVAGNILADATGTAFTPQTGWAPESITYGSMALAALPGADSVSTRPQWDDVKALWDDFAQDGRIEPNGSGEPSAPGSTWNGAISAACRLEPGAKKRVTFALAWHFPNRTRQKDFFNGPKDFQYDFRLGNQYNNRYKNAAEVVDHFVKNAEPLERTTRLFHDTLYSTSLPHWLVDAVSANIASVRSPIFVWLEDGTFGGFEGTDGCCPLNCTHVYNYAMTTAYLFPELERKVRELDLLVQMHPEQHYIPHRLVVPLSEPRAGNEIGGPFHHALDGELGTLLKTCREWRLNGDREWLAKVWPNARKVMEHVLKDHDEGADGVLRGEQPNTYDTHLYGSNTFVGSLYLASLRAMEEMAKAMNEPDFAKTCRERFEMGYKGYDSTCWNGEYYENIFDAPGVDPKVYNDNNCYGPGCFSDQLLGQWWAWMLDLGDILPPDHVKAALGAMYKYNWRADLSNHVHHQRVFAEGHEKGLLMGTWPRGGRPEHPILYCDEVWTGIEYQVAASFIYAGMLEEGLQVVKGARDRYTGDNRNPWAEIECGAHYARALASWSLLHALAGFDYDGATQRLTIAPHISAPEYSSFFSAGKAWGTLLVSQGNEVYGVAVKGGTLKLASLRIPVTHSQVNAAAGFLYEGKATACRVEKKGTYFEVILEKPIEIEAGKTLAVQMKPA